MNKFLLRPLVSLSHGISFPVENIVMPGFLNVYKMNDNKLQLYFCESESDDIMLFIIILSLECNP